MNGAFSQHGGGRPRPLLLQVVKSPDPVLTFTNLCAVSARDFPASPDGGDAPLIVNGRFVIAARRLTSLPSGAIGLSDVQRTWMQLAMTDRPEVQPYDPFSGGAKAYIGGMTLEVKFAGRKTTDIPYDVDALQQHFMQIYRDQVFAPGQQLLMDFQSMPLRLTVLEVELVDIKTLTSQDPNRSTLRITDPSKRGMVAPESGVDFVKDPKSPIVLKAAAGKPNTNPIIKPGWKFSDMGIGGLDDEFSAIFRRAFLSRIYSKDIIAQMGISHVRGILLYGPPGTGKTLIARQIGKMLNAREPKIINGPEVLNKYVGQSEENIRKLFADAEKEQKEKGDESGLHIIIFDELDAVCKQRGSGAGGGTGVGDSVVNQLLSKLDGVEQLNNLLLIGMTNRKDMIDDALLRPGRLEVHMEIPLPDEAGRLSIFKIHTAHMSKNGKLAQDVDLPELARLARNFSGAEIKGLVNAGSSYALTRHTKQEESTSQLKPEVGDIQVRMGDFLRGLDDVHAAFGASSEEDLKRCVEKGIVHFSPHIDRILREAQFFIKMTETGRSALNTVLISGPKGSGKTALAAQIAMDSGFPFVRLLRALDMVGMNDDRKVQHISKVFADAYKSPLSVLVLDNMELMVGWNFVGPRYDSTVVAALKSLLMALPPKGHPLLILGTTSNSEVLDRLGFEFENQIYVRDVRTPQELAIIMQKSGEFSQEESGAVLRNIEETTGSKVINVGIARILHRIDSSTLDEVEDHVDRFAELMSAQIATNSRRDGPSDERRYIG